MPIHSSRLSSFRRADLIAAIDRAPSVLRPAGYTRATKDALRGHVVKMTGESVQFLYTVHAMVDRIENPYAARLASYARRIAPR